MKKLFSIVLPIITFMAFTNVALAGASISGPSSVTNGQSFSVSVNLTGVAAWEVHLKASGPVSGCKIDAADSSANAENINKTISATCKATSTGTIKLSLSGNVTNASGTYSNVSSSKSISVNAKSTNQNSKTSSKSSDNTLKSLEVEGQKIEFDKNKETYDISLENGTTKIKINASAFDSKAKVEGTGEKEVKEGDNKLEVKVTAENGDVKTYVINANVDTKPIKVTVDGTEYSLVKKKDELPTLELEHEDMTLNFDGIDVPAYRIDKISYVLVGLKDEEGNINLYKYVSYKDHETPDEYTLFKVLSSEKNYISYLEFPEKLIPSNYKKFKEELMEDEYDVYKLNKKSDFCLFYGINILTGEKNIYKYDLKEKTIQIYDESEISALEKKYDKKIETREYIILGAFGGCAFLLLTVIILLATRKRKFNKLVKRYEADQKVKMAQDRLNEIREKTKENNS